MDQPTIWVTEQEDGYPAGFNRTLEGALADWAENYISGEPPWHTRRNEALIVDEENEWRWYRFENDYYASLIITEVAVGP